MEQGEDPALVPFLQILDGHISAHPEQLQPMTTDLVTGLDDLVGAVDVDLDASPCGWIEEGLTVRWAGE